MNDGLAGEARAPGGAALATVGSTGESLGPHLHYQVMHQGVAIHPTPYLAGVPPSVPASLPRIPGVQ